MGEVVKDFWAGMPLGMYVILLLSIGLGVAGFLVPPLGVINGSVLKAMALILGAAWLFYVTAHIPVILASGAKIRAEYGNAKIEIGRQKKNEVIWSEDEHIEKEKEEENGEEQVF